MRAILIDSVNRLVYEIDLEAEGKSHLKAMQRALDDTITLAMELDTGEDLFVADNGMFLFNDFFEFEGGHQPFAGNGLIVGHKDGKSTPATSLVSDIQQRVKFMDRITLRLQQFLEELE